ncbi:unnamed protein product [Calicophoron daubneyi]|uniref:Probable cytosolic iron-sulfur protein assembly protein CIAO1 homolog n=1 Tax=Calicophoron daubneyi TaxID=300641 RepID=A0AAV2SY80_CALDB
MLPAKKLLTIDGSLRRIWCVVWSHSGTYLASCGEDRSITIWARAADEMWESQCVLSGHHRRSIRCVTWSPCDHYLASASFDSTVIIWKIDANEPGIDAEPLATLEGHTSEVKCVAWAPSGRLLASCGRDKSVWFWEFDEEEDVQCMSVLQSHSQDVKSVSWHPTEEVLVSCGYDNTINLYKEELDDWAVAVRLDGHTSTVWKAAFCPSGDILASCSDDHSVKLWTFIDRKDKYKKSNWFCLCTLSGYHTDTVFDLDWSPDGNLLSSCGADNRLYVFALPEAGLQTIAGRPEFSEPPTVWSHVPDAHSEDINCVRWKPDQTGKQSVNSIEGGHYLELCTAGDDGKISLWSVFSVKSLGTTLARAEAAID